MLSRSTRLWTARYPVANQSIDLLPPRCVRNAIELHSACEPDAPDWQIFGDGSAIPKHAY